MTPWGLLAAHPVGRICLGFLAACAVMNGPAPADQGTYFRKKPARPGPVPAFDRTRAALAAPIFDENPDFIACYWKAWELAFKNFHAPAVNSGFVSPFIDAAFNQNIFLWDTCFMTMFCNYAHPHVPGICSLDNFYAKQHDSGEICREIDRETGRDFEPWINADREPLFSRWGFDWERGTRRVNITYAGREPPPLAPMLTLDALNHPILAWAELESYRVTGDRERLRQVWEPLVRYHAALREYLRQGNGLYMTDSCSMDNSPRNPWLEGGGTAVDTSSEMVLFARHLGQIAEIVGRNDDAAAFARQADELAGTINRIMWDPGRRFYFDRTLNGERVPVKTVGAFWTLLACVASQEQAKALADELRNPATFGTPHRVPTLSADTQTFDGSTGCYWRGAVWAPTTMMVVRGLEEYDLDDLAREIAVEHLASVVAVYKETGTIWENYAPRGRRPGKPAKPDFVGWSGLAPITLLLEYAVGLKPNAAERVLEWSIHSPKRVGVERYWFAGTTVSLVCDNPDATGARELAIQSDAPFTLRIKLRDRIVRIDVPQGRRIDMKLR